MFKEMLAFFLLIILFAMLVFRTPLTVVVQKNSAPPDTIIVSIPPVR